ncbi:heterokaryon incompatibility Het-C [Aureobasidium pullulans]|uniref:Heterokaryon incompatibility Het-C n=1 Tax=Aureobasidium pullulans TaxID=5580 RepID=A0A4S8SVJ6_AURPU|nr:heterokaryon incompatibility Het-C [Aureobasidium pullulans]
MANTKLLLFLCLVAVLLFATPTHAFGAGNIASISKIEGKNWRHGDIEDMLKTVDCLKKHKWTSMMIKRVYFGNWLRDYSQAVDVGTLKGVPASTIRILVWVLAFMSFGYATAEFEVTDERLGVYRPEEHIDNPKDYADNQDARQFDQRLRGPVSPQELAIDPDTGMKNYIANERGDWATSAGYIRYSFKRAIHYGRLYTHGQNKGEEKDLCEALRCLGQSLHCLEDWGAHTNYTELALRELGHNNVFPHVGANTEINLRGKRVFPLVTGTFGGVDFMHSVLGEATDHVTQSEVDEMQSALNDASAQGKRSGSGPSGEVSGLVSLLSKVPGTSGLCQEAVRLQTESDQYAAQNGGAGARGFDDGGYSQDRAWNPVASANNTADPQAIVAKIYPILVFRDNVVRSISNIVSKIPGLESLIEKITEKVTLIVMGLLAPYITPLIAAASNSLKQGSSSVVDASGKHQYEVWTDPFSTDPTHSLLSKDHFSNILNEPAGKVAACILQYVAPRIIYAFDHPDVPEEEVLNDVLRVFHHPAIRDPHCEIQTKMFAVVEQWARQRPGGGHDLDRLLSSEGVKAGHNHTGGANPHLHSHGGPGDMQNVFGMGQHPQRGMDASGTPEQYGSGYGQPGPATPQAGWGAPPPADYNQQYQPPAPAGFANNDPYAYPSAYQQGYEVPYDAGTPYGAPPPGPPQQFGGQYGAAPPGPPPPGQYGGYDQQQQHQQHGYGQGPPPGYDQGHSSGYYQGY